MIDKVFNFYHQNIYIFDALKFFFEKDKKKLKDEKNSLK